MSNLRDESNELKREHGAVHFPSAVFLGELFHLVAETMDIDLILNFSMTVPPHQQPGPWERKRGVHDRVICPVNCYLLNSCDGARIVIEFSNLHIKRGFACFWSSGRCASSYSKISEHPAHAVALELASY